MISSELQPSKNTGDVSVQVFKTDSGVLVYYVNGGKNTYNITFSKSPISYKIESISGSQLSSAAGRTYFDKKYPADQLTSLKLNDKAQKSTSFEAQPFSMGYIEFTPGK